MFGGRGVVSMCFCESVNSKNFYFFLNPGIIKTWKFDSETHTYVYGVHISKQWQEDLFHLT